MDASLRPAPGEVVTDRANDLLARADELLARAEFAP